MKITSVDVIKVLAGRPSVAGTPWNPIIVRINTDEGISGFGEAGLCYGNANHAAFGGCVDFAELIIGMDPMKIEAIWNKLHRTTFWGMGGGGVIFSAMSAAGYCRRQQKSRPFQKLQCCAFRASSCPSSARIFP